MAPGVGEPLLGAGVVARLPVGRQPEPAGIGHIGHSGHKNQQETAPQSLVAGHQTK